MVPIMQEYIPCLERGVKSTDNKRQGEYREI